MTLENQCKLVLLNEEQQVEFSEVIATQQKLQESFNSNQLDSSIDIKYKLKPKFTLQPTQEQSFSLANSSTPARTVSLIKRSICKGVSLYIPVYNRASYLPATIESILAQTYTNFELIIWDDGSTDNSLEIARNYALQDTRIKVYHQEHQGQGTAMVNAVAIAEGRYLAQVDSDDLLHPQALSKTVAVLETNPEIGMVYTDHLVIDALGKKRGLGQRCLIPYSPERLLIDFMTFHFRLMRREVYELVGGINHYLGTAEDYDLCLKLSEVTQIRHLSEPLYYYRWHGNNISTTNQLKQAKCSSIAVNRALVRRGLDQKFKLEVKLNPQYSPQRQTKIANKVFGIGLSRTATTSLNQALCLLGIPSIHLPSSLNKIAEFDAATDTPIAAYYQKLDLLFPDSKFILTIRNTRRWLESYQLHEQRVLKFYQGQKPQWLKELTIRCYGQEYFEPQQWLKAYGDHLHSVTKYFQGREADLLILNICGGQGWSQLCSFLGCAAPNIPFPHYNRSANISCKVS